MAEDYYKTLGVSRNASESQIQNAYRKLARKYHPDLNQDDKDAKRKFQEVQKAFDVLNDSSKRELYDRYGSSFESMSGGPQGGATGPVPGFEGIDLSNLFSQQYEGSGEGGFANIFNQFTQGAQRSPRRRSPRQHGADLRHELSIPLPTAISGGEANIRIQRADGKTETIAVKIPSGIEDGKRIRLRGQGEKPARNGQAGDILITIRVQSHACFQRNGKHLIVKVPVTLAEAALGATVDIPSPRGTLTLKIPPGSSSGIRLRVKGHGVPTKTGSAGDLYAEVQIVLPESLNDDDRDLIKKINGRYSFDPRANLKW